MAIKAVRWAAVLVVGATMACARNRTSDELALSGGEGVPTVTVRNDNWLDVNVYVVHGPSRFRIGTVSTSTSRTFRLPREGGGASPLQILADPIGENRQYITDPVVLTPGQWLEVKVGSPLSLSSFAIWNR